MAGQKTSSRSQYVSKGERVSSMSTRTNVAADRMLNKIRARAKGKDVVWNVSNPNKEETNKPFKRVRESGKIWLDNIKNQGKKKKGETSTNEG